MLQVAAFPYTLHFERPAATSRGHLTTRKIELIRVWDGADPRRVGWGECGPMPGLSRDDLPDFADSVQEAIGVINAGYTPEPGDLAHLPSLAFGLEVALRDLQMGGRQQLWDTAFTRGEIGLPTHGLIWIDSPDKLFAQIDAKVAAGFSVVKMKVGALPLADELALLQRVRTIYPANRIEVRLDANGAFAADEALGALEALSRYDIAFLEQPVRAGQWPVLAEICRQSPIPIAIDEEMIPVVESAERRRLLDLVQPQHLIIKPTLLGGFSAAEAWIAEAEARGIDWWINSLLESNLGLNAICQWTSFIGGGRIHGLGAGSLFSNNIRGPISLVGHELVIDRALRWQLPAELPQSLRQSRPR